MEKKNKKDKKKKRDRSSSSSTNSSKSKSKSRSKNRKDKRKKHSNIKKRSKSHEKKQNKEKFDNNKKKKNFEEENKRKIEGGEYEKRKKNIEEEIKEKEEAKQDFAKIHGGDLINSLKEDPSYLAQKYNEIHKKNKEEEEKKKEAIPVKKNILKQENVGRSGGIYIPPHKLEQLQREIMENEQKNGIEHQKLMWELLRKSINGIINKVSSFKLYFLLYY